ncbi:uncharacterized protein LOC116603542 [Nematostella vectensis]|uniref:uncharacterized protein LOC116603542 n=1 Tax=Nematostella vectensis TaxID=45351 RepID=UPI0020773CFD|nr:uncharacterized protein LOC116603542 [Nematostella vectensis]
MPLSPTRASQIVCTGTTIFVIGAITIGLSLVLAFGGHKLGSVLESGAAYWAGIPVAFAGIIGILAGSLKKRVLVKFFLLLSMVSFGIGVVMSVFIGLMLRKWRSRGDCSYTFCPFDNVSILLIILLTNCALLCILSITGIIESSLPNTDQDTEMFVGDLSTDKDTSIASVTRPHANNTADDKNDRKQALTRGKSYHKAIEKSEFKNEMIIPDTSV